MNRTVTIFIILLFLETSLFAADRTLAFTAPSQADIGQPFLVTVRSVSPLQNVSVSWQGKDSLLTPENGAFSVLLGTDLKNAKAGTSELRISCMIEGELREIKHNIKLSTHRYPRENLKVEADKLTPPQSLSERIKREAGLGRAAIQTDTPGSAPLLPLFKPVTGSYSSVYGKSRYLNGQFKGRHGGVDMRAPLGTPVKAAASGRVILTGDFWFAGKCVYIDHGAGLISFYCHLSKISTSLGSSVERGEIIGLSGKSGRVTGPHLHFSLSWRGEFFDPAPLLEKET